jgi:hypothetical protein
MRRLVIAAVAALVVWQAAEACGPWYVLRAALNPVFWQPFVKTIPDLLGPAQRATDSAVFAGMSAGGRPELAAARKAYREVARWRLDHFQPWDQQEPPPLDASLAAARQAVDSALAAAPSPAERDELRLIRCKVTVREAESLLVMSRTKFVAPATAPQETLRRARAELTAYLSEADTPALVSEARGWMARCHYLLGEHHQAARIYLDELARSDSAIGRERLLTSLRILFPYNGSAARLADHLDEYFDTPQHALFVINLVTNPIQDDENERRAMGAVGRQALAALERHRELFSKGADGDRLALAAMRASLYMGHPASALKVEESLPAGSPARTEPEVRWMLAAAHFLLGHYAQAEPHLVALAAAPATPPWSRSRARLGLLAVYQKLSRPADQLVSAFRYEADQREGASGAAGPDDEWYVRWWPYVGSVMDLPYLLDVQLTEEELHSARAMLVGGPPITLDQWTSTGKHTLTAVDLLDYELAVRAARREDYEKARAIYDHLGFATRSRRMGRLTSLYAPAGGTRADEHLKGRYAYGAFLADQSERVFFNDLVWQGLQRYAFVQSPSDQPHSPALLTGEETRLLTSNERVFRDAQEERWQAFLILDDVAERAGHSELGARAARKAIECLDRINTERFGRESDIQASRRRLASWLREAP